MIQLGINSVIAYAASEDTTASRFAILWISGDGVGGYWIDLADDRSLPTSFSRAEVEDHLFNGAGELCGCNVPESGPISIKAAQRCDQLWKALGPILTREPDVYIAVERTGMYREAACASGLTLNAVRRLFQQFWRGGKVQLSLAPRFAARGGQGREREPSNAKLGRPAIKTHGSADLNREMKRAILAVIKRETRRLGRLNLPHCYRVWCNLLFYQDAVDANGKPTRVLQSCYEVSGVPTCETFKKYYYRSADRLAMYRTADPQRFNLTVRPLPSSAASETWGPGSRFLIDATMADVYLVSRINRSRIIGRPVIYIVQDVWSRLIVGLYVTIEDASWRSAMFALAHAAGSKVEYCRRFDIEIEEADWPRAGLPARLLSDRGEVDCLVAGQLAKHFNRIIEAAEPYRGDVKGLVETQFNPLQVRFGEFVPGYVLKNQSSPARDYRLDALFDPYDFEQTMIDLVLERNQQILRRYDRDQGMPVGTVPASPLALYHWGLQHRSGRMQYWDDADIRFRLMPTATAPIDRFGLRFGEKHYVSPGLLANMSQARLGNAQTAKISYLPGDTDIVLRHDDREKHGYEVCTLSDRSRAFAGCTMSEAALELYEQEQSRASGRIPELSRQINVDARMQKRIEVAAARRLVDPEASNAARVHGIRDNRTLEQAGERQAQSARFLEGLACPPQRKTEDQDKDDEFAEKSLADFLRRS